MRVIHRRAGHVSLGIAMVVGALTLALLAHEQAPAPASRAPASSGEAMPEPPPGPSTRPSVTFAPRAGRRYTYEFERQISIKGFAQPMPEIAYGGQLRIDVVRVDRGVIEAIATDRIVGQDALKPYPMLLKLTPDGQLLSLTAPRAESATSETGSEHAGILKDLVSSWMFTLREDTVGAYAADFEDLADEQGSPRRKKTKTTYYGSSPSLPSILSSVHELTWSLAHGMPQAVRGTERTQLANGQLTLDSASSYAIKLVEVVANPHLRGGSDPRIADLGRVESLALAGAPGNRARARAGQPVVSWPELAKRLATIGSLAAPGQLALFGDLVTSMRAHPQNIAALAAMLDPAAIAGGARSALFKMIVGTLATVATPDAQRALAAIYQNPDCPIDGKGTILSALTTTQAALDAETRGFLAAQAQATSQPDLASAAAWALGSSLQNAAPGDASATRAIASLQQAWTAAPSTTGPTSERAMLLDAIGNSGRLEFLPIVSGVITGSIDPTLRGRAVFALRFMNDASATALLGSALGDASPVIRAAAANAMRVAQWNPSFATPLRGCSAGEPVSSIRSACAQALTRASGS